MLVTPLFTDCHRIHVIIHPRPQRLPLFIIKILGCLTLREKKDLVDLMRTYQINRHPVRNQNHWMEHSDLCFPMTH